MPSLSAVTIGVNGSFRFTLTRLLGSKNHSGMPSGDVRLFWASFGVVSKYILQPTVTTSQLVLLFWGSPSQVTVSIWIETFATGFWFAGGGGGMGRAGGVGPAFGTGV